MTDTFLTARWENLVMANYAVSPDLLLPYLPAGVELDLFGGEAYVSLVGFMFNRTRLFSVPIPFFGSFEEINLRFYVKRVGDNNVKRGVVFINETVPYKPVAWLANKLYKEHYTAVPTSNEISIHENLKTIKYGWKVNKTWKYMHVQASCHSREMPAGSLEEFIFEHYYGYTKINHSRSQEYEIKHPRWLVNDVLDYTIDCDFSAMYGEDFGCLNNQQPASVILAEGSPVSVKWKRQPF